MTTPPTAKKRIAHVAVHGMGVHAPFSGIATFVGLFRDARTRDFLTTARATGSDTDGKTDAKVPHAKVPHAKVTEDLGQARVQSAAEGTTDPDWNVTYGAELIDGELVSYAEFFHDGARHRVYEIFYSAIPKGHCNSADILRFVWNAISNVAMSVNRSRKLGERSGRQPILQRLVLGEVHTYPVEDNAVVLLAGLAMALTLVLVGLIMPILAFAALFVDDLPLAHVAVGLNILSSGPLLLGGLSILITRLLRIGNPKRPASRIPLDITVTIIALVGFFVAAVAIGWSIHFAGHPNAIPMLNVDEGSQRMILGTFSAVSFLVAAFIRNALVDSVGDVVAYVSESKASSFQSVRDEVQSNAKRRLLATFAVNDEVRVYGHSLGSVVAYDALNRVLIEHPEYAPKLGLLVTYGSPLGLIAFVFQFQAGAAYAMSRQKLAAARQPLLSRATREITPWVNVYAPFDIFSPAPLRLFSQPEPSPYNVCNIEDNASKWIGLAHVEYTRHVKFVQILVEIGALELDIPRAKIQALAQSAGGPSAIVPSDAGAIAPASAAQSSPAPGPDS
ncbi:MAG: hypothetical protein SFX74_04845 [Fimbriimonadaceae bacterium]|nr:hypothetical protein [Fimbriimonadaceae bacterium]